MTRMVALLIYCVLLFAVDIDAFCLSTQLDQQQAYIAVVDAGSTGTRLHIYAIHHNENNQLTSINEIWIKKIKPGFASISPDQQSITQYFDRLFNGAPDFQIPVYVYATAGMRLLPESKQAAYFQGMKHWFNHHPSRELIDYKTISGREEGLYDWLSVNYQLGNFNDDAHDFTGVMDMGGASVQIVFPVKDTQNINPDNLIELQIGSQQIKLFAQSFLGLGQTTLSYQFLDLNSCFADNYELPGGGVGQGDAHTCQSDITKLINGVHGVSEKVQPAVAGNPTQQWYVLGGIKFLLDDRLFPVASHNQFTSQALLDQGDTEVCHKQWGDLIRENPDHDSIYSYCLLSSYYYALMVEGYGLKANQPINLLPSNNIDWTLGVVVKLQAQA